MKGREDRLATGLIKGRFPKAQEDTGLKDRREEPSLFVMWKEKERGKETKEKEN